MSKQINYYAKEEDKAIIATVLKSVFGQLIDIPYYKSDFSIFDGQVDGRKIYLTEDGREKDIFYRTHEYYDGTVVEVLDYRQSPVLEYSLPFINSNNAHVEGRFYCCSNDLEFSKKVSIFFTKLKKEFWYVKKWKTYVSKSIDVENSLFLSIKITKQDLQ
ncbi:MAG: hypothetical protein LBD59_07440 [Prevotellaceae bacterium]|jgi:hypothetical protein|nr:hypothetical protein [Prevotellaceae bacterium]